MTIELPMSERILDAAEDRMRKVGYNGVSFRDLADDVGVKSASVHYHFAQKQDLGAAVVRRYSEKLMDSIRTDAERKRSPAAKIAVYVDHFRAALKRDGMICLCGMLGAEAAGLPKPVVDELREFFAAHIEWMAPILQEAGVDSPRRKAAAIVSAMEGALIVATVMGDTTTFEAVAADALDGVAG